MNYESDNQSAFIEEPSFRIADGDGFTLVGRLVYFSLLNGMVIIPDQFPTDFASIPRIFRAVHPVNGRHRLAAVVHDYLCNDGITRRKMADKVFSEAMRVCGVAGWRMIQFYIAVRIGGILGRKK